VRAAVGGIAREQGVLTMKKALETRRAPAAIGPYSQAIEDGGLVFCSGQVGIDPATGTLVAGGIEAETRRVLENLREVLRAANLGFEDIVKTTIFLVDLAEFDVVNRVYGEHLVQPYPARSTVQVAALPRGARVEIEAVAIRRS
jgi:2-iminobutanoate/2-iminopropanoate deaminase